jgi:hypothetical protein
LPVMAIVVVFELMIREGKNSLSLKGEKFRATSSVDILVLGSSHHQNAVNPKFLSGSALNVAYGSQDYKLDYTILKEAFDSGKNPKIVVVEAAYHSLLRENPKDYWRNGLYEYFYDIDLNGNFLSKQLLISSNLKFFKQYLLQRLLDKKDAETINQWGFDENDFDGFFKVNNYDSLKILSDARQRLKNRVAQSHDSLVVARNTKYLDAIAALCETNNVKLVVATPPVYASQRSLFTRENLELRQSIIELLTKKYKDVTWLTFENSGAFSAKDFINDDHLNSAGAEKFTKLLDKNIWGRQDSATIGLFPD